MTDAEQFAREWLKAERFSDEEIDRAIETLKANDSLLLESASAEMWFVANGYVGGRLPSYQPR